MRASSIISLALLDHQAFARASTGGLSIGRRHGGARGRVLKRTINSSLSPRQNGLLSFISDDSLECDYGKECDGGCIPDGAKCCNDGRGGWCEADMRCERNKGCCEVDSTDCVGPGYDCLDDGEKICGGYCVPGGSMCCDSGFYCDVGEECTTTGCIPAGAASCGDGEYCGRGEECAGTGCTPESEDPFSFIEGACGDTDEGDPCDHTITASSSTTTRGEPSTSTSETGEAEPTAASTDNNSNGPSDTATDSTSPSETDTPDDDAASSPRGGLIGMIVVTTLLVLLT